MFQIFLQLFCFTHTTYTPQSHSSQIYTHLEAVGFRWRPAVSFYITWNPMSKSIENWSFHCRYVMKELSYIINIVDFTYKGHNQSFIAFPLGRRTSFLHSNWLAALRSVSLRLQSLNQKTLTDYHWCNGVFYTDPFLIFSFDLYFDFHLIRIVPWQDKGDFRRILVWWQVWG